MAYAATHRGLPRSSPTSAGAIDPPARRSVLRRLLDAILDARQRQANRELAQYLVRSGGRLTDDIEREMNQRLSRSDWNFRA